jgi:murein DD-endopeptidase MepM/ murein hydrolase activator NlpD
MWRALLFVMAAAGCTRRSPPGPSCNAAELPKLHWPLAGSVSKDWAVIAYLDADPGPGKRDFKGFTGDDAITYDGHDGIDIDIGGFERMDRGYPVEAGLDAVVQSSHDGEFDRQTDSHVSNLANSVVLRAPNGFTVVYWHLRKGSVRVKAGDRVTRGQVLGEVGSSGASNGPHLHIGAYDCKEHAIDLMAASQFADGPPYDAPIGLMHMRISSTPDFKTEITSSKPGQEVYFDFLFGAIHHGDRTSLRVTGPGSPATFGGVNDGPRQTPSLFWHQPVTFPAGNWQLVTSVNDVVLDKRDWTVR